MSYEAEVYDLQSAVAALLTKVYRTKCGNGMRDKAKTVHGFQPRLEMHSGVHD